MLRRHFLAATAAAAASTPQLRLSAITDEIAFTPADAFAFCARYGLRYIELRNVPGTKRGYWDLPPGERRTFAAEVRDRGLQVSFIDSGLLATPLPGTTPVRTPGPLEQERFGRRMEDLQRVLELAEGTGCKMIRCFAFRRVADPLPLLPRIAEMITPMVEVCAKAGVRLLLENESSCNVNTCAEIAAIAPLIPSSWFGFNWDPGNAAHVETAYPDGYEKLPVERIGNVQVKGKGILPGGSDPVDWARILPRLHRDGYTGCIGLETHTPNRQADSHIAIRELIRMVS